MNMSTRLALMMLALGSTLAQAKEALPHRPPQLVLLAFDGSESIPKWEETRKFARDNHVKFTYFVSGVLFLGRVRPLQQGTLDSDPINAYHGPQHAPGQSDIGFSSWDTGSDGLHQPVIVQRIKQMNLAKAEGHELASHANGHFNGSTWSKEEWRQEFIDFNSLLFNDPYGGTRGEHSIDRSRYIGSRQYEVSDFKGFRAPYLSQNANLYPVLREMQFTYDTSRVAEPGYWPQKINGIWNFPLAQLTFKGLKKNPCRSDKQQCKTLSMDYNLYVSQALPGTRNPPQEITDGQYRTFLRNQALELYQNYFASNYYGNRAPVHIGHHFANWNAGIYWEVLQEFAKSVCNLKDVRCITYSELVAFMETHTKAEIDAYRVGKFAKPSPEPSPLVANDEWDIEIARLERRMNKAQTMSNVAKRATLMEKLGRQLMRWKTFQRTPEESSARAYAGISVGHFLRSAKKKPIIRNKFHDRTYEQLKDEGLAHGVHED